MHTELVHYHYDNDGVFRKKIHYFLVERKNYQSTKYLSLSHQCSIWHVLVLSLSLEKRMPAWIHLLFFDDMHTLSIALL